MPTITYAGVKYTQIRHAIKCVNCKETVESKDLHDFKYCSCGNVGVDGGISDGNRILGDLTHMQDRSMYYAIVKKKRVWLPEYAIEQIFKNRQLKH